VTTEHAVLRRIIGTALRYHRERLGLGLADIADLLECDQSKVSRIETGKRGIRRFELETLLDEYEVGGDERSTLLALTPWRGHSARYWWQHDGKGLQIPDGLRTYLLLECHAVSITVYSPQYVPGLLQTPRYATAVLTPAAGTSGDAAAFTVARQTAIRNRRTALTVILGEAALYQQAGTPEVMQEQYARLAAATEEISLRILPFTATPHPCLNSGSVTLLKFAAAPYLDAVHLDGPGGGICLIGGQDSARYADALTGTRAGTLTPGETARLLAKMTDP
jgi:transcriptional regulator with XRE-family HTH domain